MAGKSIIGMLYTMEYIKFSIKKDCILLMDNEKSYAQHSVVYKCMKT